MLGIPLGNGPEGNSIVHSTLRICSVCISISLYEARAKQVSKFVKFILIF